MPEKMRIGELLLLEERIEPWLLAHTLKEQAHTRQRLVSLLVSRAQLDPDVGALALSQQLGYPGAMQRHLERRDSSVLALLPRELGARWVVLPLGRARTGAVVVVARDPSPILTAALEHAMKTSVILAVTPSVQLERLVRASYGLAPAPDDQPLPGEPPTLSDIGSVRLEDETPLPVRRPRTVSYAFTGLPELPTRAAPAPVSAIDATMAEIDRAITAIAVERLVMAYAQKRWRSALLARVEGDLAHGVRGHGTHEGVDAITLPMTPESMLSIAHTARRITTDHPHTNTQGRLQHVLGAATAAAPVTAGARVVAVLVVGEVVDASPTDAIADLDRLVDALGAAYDRFAR